MAAIAAQRTRLEAAALAAALAVTGALLGWRGGDLPNQLYRFDLFDRVGFSTWSNLWFAGHATPGYSVIVPALGALLGPVGLGLISAVVAAWCFDLLVTTRYGPQARWGSLWFAAGTVSNLAVGRLAFAAGLAFGLAALALEMKRHRILGPVAGVLCTLASPLAGAFLMLSGTAWFLGAGARRGLYITVAAATPLAITTVLFPEGGHFPFRMGSLIWVLAVCAIALIGLPGSERAIRTGFALYGLACIAAFVLPTPLGGNITRFGMYVAGPLLLCAMPRKLIVAALAPALLWWQWSPAIDGIVRAPSDPSAHASYYEPLISYLQTQGRGLRVEVPPTRRHWEAVHVATQVPLARGWERQLDLGYNEIFYDDVLPSWQYYQWLRDNAVQYVALSDATPDYSAEQERALLLQGVSYLTPVMTTPDWRVWKVVDATPMVSGPGDLLSLDDDRVVLHAHGPGDLLVRVHTSPRWSINGAACLVDNDSDWLTVHAVTAGVIELQQSLRSGPHCDAGDKVAPPTDG
jgi:hypothetical protein